MRKSFLRDRFVHATLGLALLLIALNLSAKASINYAADQPGACPPAASVHDDEDANDSAPAASTAAPARSSSTPIKSGRSSRPKWKALLPGAIK